MLNPVETAWELPSARTGVFTLRERVGQHPALYPDHALRQYHAAVKTPDYDPSQATTNTHIIHEHQLYEAWTCLVKNQQSKPSTPQQPPPMANADSRQSLTASMLLGSRDFRPLQLLMSGTHRTIKDKQTIARDTYRMLRRPSRPPSHTGHSSSVQSCELQNFASLMRRFPAEIRSRVLSWTDPTLFCAMDWQGQNCELLHWFNAAPVFISRMMQENQFPLLASLMPLRSPVSYKTHGYGGPLFHTSELQYTQFIAMVDTRTEIAVEAISARLPLMRETGLMRFYLTHLWMFFCGSHRSLSLKQEQYNYLTSLPQSTRTGLDNFSNNLTAAYFDRYSLEYSKWLVLDEFTSRPKLLHDIEMHGIFDILKKEHVLARLRSFFSVLANNWDPLTDDNLKQIYRFWAPPGKSNPFWRCSEPSQESSLAYPEQSEDISFVLPVHLHRVRVTGTRLDGQIAIFGDILEDEAIVWEAAIYRDHDEQDFFDRDSIWEPVSEAQFLSIMERSVVWDVFEWDLYRAHPAWSGEDLARLFDQS